MTTFGERLRDLRSRFDLPQERLAKRTGLSVAALYALERGAATPSLDTVQRITEALGVSLKVFDGCHSPARAKVRVG